VTALDLLRAEGAARLVTLTRPIEYVPEMKRAIAQLEEFRRTGTRLALVIDEHGHLSGLVTMTDLLEEISGEVIESTDLHKVRYRKRGERTYVVPARMEIRFFNEEFDTQLVAESSETLAGLLLERLGRIPARGETCVVEGVVFRVVGAEPNRIVTLEATLPLGVEHEGGSG
jgi:CBS domain containing-hemolysin-like protein